MAKKKSSAQVVTRKQRNAASVAQKPPPPLAPTTQKSPPTARKSPLLQGSPKTLTQLRCSLLLYQLILFNTKPKQIFKKYLIKFFLFGTMFTYMGIGILMIILFYHEEKYGITLLDFNNFDYLIHLYMFRIGPTTLVILLWGLIWTMFTDRLEFYLTNIISSTEFIKFIPKIVLASIFTVGLTSLLPLIGNLDIESIGKGVFKVLLMIRDANRKYKADKKAGVFDTAA